MGAEGNDIPRFGIFKDFTRYFQKSGGCDNLQRVNVYLVNDFSSLEKKFLTAELVTKTKRNVASWDLHF